MSFRFRCKLSSMFGDKDPYPMKISTIAVVDNQARRKVKQFRQTISNRRRPKIGDASGFTEPKAKPNAAARNSDSGISDSFDVIDLEFNGDEIASISHIKFRGKEKDDSKDVSKILVILKATK